MYFRRRKSARCSAKPAWPRRGDPHPDGCLASLKSMVSVRPSAERGASQLDWLDSRHTFSFDRYYDPRHMGFRSLRVINEDHVAPGKGFPTHPHRDMEIVTYVLEGTLQHKDSMGNGSIIRPGEVQRMSAGTGITHSEYNPSGDEAVHFLQIWILPEQRGIEPSYEQRDYAERLAVGELLRVASGHGAAGAVVIHQDAELLAARMQKGARAGHALAPQRHAWIQAARGSFEMNGIKLEAGDGAGISEERTVEIFARTDCEVLLFDLA
jgi:redox-sensitive bicupin YhaK (pirin superfamily)